MAWIKNKYSTMSWFGLFFSWCEKSYASSTFQGGRVILKALTMQARKEYSPPLGNLGENKFQTHIFACCWCAS